MRTKGSARFAPYYKVQWYDARSAAWIDVQKTHTTAQAAGDAFPAGKRCRVIEVSEQGRRPLPEDMSAADILASWSRLPGGPGPSPDFVAGPGYTRALRLRNEARKKGPR